MKKEDIIKIINEYGLDKDSFIIIGGASLVMNGIIDKTSDIDIWCDSNYCKYLLDNYECRLERINELNEKAYMIDDIINFGICFKPNDIEVIGDINVASLDDTYLLKRFLNREKDKELIKILENLLEKD